MCKVNKFSIWLFDKKLLLLTVVVPQCNKHHLPLLLRYFLHFGLMFSSTHVA